MGYHHFDSSCYRCRFVGYRTWKVFKLGVTDLIGRSPVIYSRFCSLFYSTMLLIHAALF